MSQLIQIKSRLQAVETIKKITHAMRLIAMSTHAHLKHREKAFELYMTQLQDLLARVQESSSGLVHPVMQPIPGEQHRNLMIVISSQKGLCGGFNTNLFKACSYYCRRENLEKLDVIAIGKKAVDHFTHNPVGTLVSTFKTLNSATIPTISRSIIDYLSTQTPPYAQVWVVSSYLKSFFLQTPHKTTLIPFEIPKEKDIYLQEPYIWEHNQQDVINTIIQEYINTQLQHLMFQSLIAEQAARFISMDMATRNADTLLEATQLQYNKVRQAKITKELTELTGSF